MPFRMKSEKKKKETKYKKKNNQNRNSFFAETWTKVPAIHWNRNTNLLRNYDFILILDFLAADALTLISFDTFPIQF